MTPNEQRIYKFGTLADTIDLVSEHVEHISARIQGIEQAVRTLAEINAEDNGPPSRLIVEPAANLAKEARILAAVAARLAAFCGPVGEGG